MKSILALMALLAAGAVNLAITHADAAEFLPFEGRSDTLLMKGDIEHGDLNKLQAELNTRAKVGLATTYLMLDSNGGFVTPAFDIAKAVHDNRLTTVVGTGASCISSCVLIFAAGEQRFWWAGCYIGVHNAYDEAGDDAAWTVGIAKLYKEMGVPAAVIGKMIATSGDDVAWLTPEDVEGWATEATAIAADPATTTAMATSAEPKLYCETHPQDSSCVVARAPQPKLYCEEHPDDSSCVSRMPEIKTASAERAERRFCKMHKAAFPERCAAF
jgi:hypothetical protein